jgi:hypothetical protein
VYANLQLVFNSYELLQKLTQGPLNTDVVYGDENAKLGEAGMEMW